MNARTVLIFFSFIYLIIEMQAITFLSQIYTSTPTAEMLSQYERFGYASTGIGLTLFAATWFFSKKRSPLQAVLAALAVPAIYLIAIWAVYEVVHQSPSWIPASAKPRAMQASIQTMSTPQWSNLWAFYSEGPSAPSHLQTNIKRVIQHHPTPDRAVQSAYIQSFRALTAFDEHYQKSAEMLDESLWPLLWRGANRVAQVEPSWRMSTSDVEQRIHRLQRWVSRNSLSPHRWINNEIALWSLQKEDAALQSILFSDRSQGARRAITAVHYIEQSREVSAWNALGQDIPDWPAYEPHGADIRSQFRRAISQSTLSLYAHLPSVEIEYGTQGQEYRSQVAYTLASQQIAPFLFDDKGTALITLRSIYDLETRAKYINTLKTGLPPILRANWGRYQQEAIFDLSTRHDAWMEGTTPQLHEGMLRAGVITPILLVLSAVMIFINLVSIFRKNLVLATLALPAMTVIALQWWSNGSTMLLKALLVISVRESQIFLS